MIIERVEDMSDMTKKIQIEKEGICNTIMQYTNNQFILSYSNQLKSISIVEDHEIFMELVQNLFRWYESVIGEIIDSEYTIDKDSHIKSMNLLNEFLEYAKNYKE